MSRKSWARDTNLCFGDQAFYQLGQVPFVLGLMFERLATHLDHLLLGVPSWPGEFFQFSLLLRRQAKVPWTELNNDFLLGWVIFAHVRSKPKSEGLMSCWWLERNDIFCNRGSVSVPL